MTAALMERACPHTGSPQALLCWVHSDEPRWRPFWAAWEVGAALQSGSTGVILLCVTGTGLGSLGPHSGASLKEHPVQAGVSP